MSITTYANGQWIVVNADCKPTLATLEEDSVDSIVTDPPYELGFMGKKWDGTGIAYDVELWEECLRVLKPGGHLLAFGGSRTWHRMAVAIEDAGFELRDSIAWLYGSGFPKSLDVSKAIDKAAGADREVVGDRGAEKCRYLARGEECPGHDDPGQNAVFNPTVHRLPTSPATPEAERWQGWGTALKPAFEPIVVARKPLSGTVAANVLEHGTGALNIDACRVEYQGATDAAQAAVPHPAFGTKAGGQGTYNCRAGTGRNGAINDVSKGRWPTNVVLDESQAEELGDAAKFFPVFKYQAKAPSKERPRYNKPVLRLRDDLTPEQVDHVRARLAEAGVQVD